MSMVRRLGPLILAALAAARRSTGHGPTVSGSAEMAAALARREDELRAGEERLRLMLDNLSEAVAAIFPDLSLPVRNRAWLRFHGFARFDELPGLRFEDLAPLFELYDAAGRRLPAEDYPLARAMRGESFEGLELHLKRTGTDWERWASYNGTRVLGPDGRVRVAMISIRDVTERVVAEGQQQLLLAELSHRVKNTLATVQVIAARSLDGGRSLAEGREALTRRLRALAQTHDLLTVSRWQGAELAAVLAAELKPYGERALVDVPALKLSPKAAQLVALVLHELATNAAKHGALSVPGGWLEVRGGLEPASGPATLRLVWREHDGPKVIVPGHRGFGRTLIEHGVRHELGGTVRLDFEPAGLVCEFVVPAAAVRAGR